MMFVEDSSGSAHRHMINIDVGCDVCLFFWPAAMHAKIAARTSGERDPFLSISNDFGTKTICI